jgi:ABC-type antimicrobial peptide transport system permease subunit
MPIIAGRSFSSALDTTNIVFNEAAIKRLRIKEPVGQVISFNGRQYHIAGVVKDALMVSPFSPPEPAMFLGMADRPAVMLYRLNANISSADALKKLTAAFNKYNPAYPYTYEFADATYASKFNMEILIGKLAGIFAGLAIFISCLGLFGLAAYIAEQRTKEIGIRKVLGATVAQLWMMLSKDFIVLVLVSCLLASPLALYFLQSWLNKYAYRVSIGPSVFVASAIVAVAITIVTVSVQAIRAAIANPVKSLRSE